MAAAIWVLEQSNSRSMSYDTGRTSASRTFKCYDANTPSTLITPADVRALFGNTYSGDKMPAKGDTFPSDASIYAKSYAITREPNTDIWNVTWSYGNNVVGTGAQPGEVGYVEWTIDVSASFIDKFIQSPTLPTDGNLTGVQGAVTGGTQMDIEGTPVSMLKYTTEITISETISNTSGLPSIVSAMRSARGCRNKTLWEGFAPGSVVYAGGSIRRTGVATFVANHKMTEDSEYHLIQYPFRDSTGKIPTKVVDGANRANVVLWRQPFPSTIDFTTISTAW